MINNNLTIRIVGESGEGIVSTGEILSHILKGLGQQLMTFRTYPAEIKGGQCLFQLRFAEKPLHTPGEDPEILICFDEKSYFEHGIKKDNGLLIYNSDDTAPENHKPLVALGLPFTTISRDEIGVMQSKNMVALGAIGNLLNINKEQLHQFTKKWFRSKGEKAVEANTKALLAGWEFCAENYENPDKLFEQAKQKNTVLLSGNQALVLGALAAGCRFYAGYPITPASNIMEMMIRELPKFGGVGLQTEDEMAAVSAVIGASFAGTKAMTATSGPGFSLMQEQIGLAVMAEIPIVIIDAQRAGPSTGMPTKMEQGDLLMAIHGSHGEAPRIVLAPGTVDECFSTTVAAFNLAEALRAPVVLLTDLVLAQRTESINLKSFKKPQIIDRKKWQSNEDQEHVPYKITESGVSTMSVPGQMDAMYVATGLEHDEQGRPNYTPAMHDKMLQKRHEKLNGAFAYYKGYQLFHGDASNNNVGIISWGSTQGPILEALDLLAAESVHIPLLQLKLLNPLPLAAINEFAKSVEKLVVPEHNYTGQLAGLIEAGIHRPVIRLRKVEGLPFHPSELAKKLKTFI